MENRKVRIAAVDAPHALDEILDTVRTVLPEATVTPDLQEIEHSELVVQLDVRAAHPLGLALSPSSHTLGLAERISKVSKDTQVLSSGPVPLNLGSPPAFPSRLIDDSDRSAVYARAASSGIPTAMWTAWPTQNPRHGWTLAVPTHNAGSPVIVVSRPGRLRFDWQDARRIASARGFATD